MQGFAWYYAAALHVLGARMMMSDPPTERQLDALADSAKALALKMVEREPKPGPLFLTREPEEAQMEPLNILDTRNARWRAAEERFARTRDPADLSIIEAEQAAWDAAHPGPPCDAFTDWRCPKCQGVAARSWGTDSEPVVLVKCVNGHETDYLPSSGS